MFAAAHAAWERSAELRPGVSPVSVTATVETGAGTAGAVAGAAAGAGAGPARCGDGGTRAVC